MAEAVVEDRPQQPQRFYCHMCSVEIHMVTSDYTCPICAGGFIEELPPAIESSSSEDVEMTEPNGTDNLEMIRNELRSLLMHHRAGSSNRSTENDQPEEDQQQNPSASSSRSFSLGRRNPRHARMTNSDNILYEILQALSGGSDGAFGNASMFFMGNPGDYAWGHEGLDTIVTQLLNQVDTTGPPPLPKEKIDEIPKVEIIQDQVDIKLQCSVCWEDFKLSESVRQLPCLHVYHENCIVPWLQLHGTCPICRKSLSPETSDVTNSLRSAASAFIRSSSEESPATSNSVNNGISSQTNTSSSQPDLQLPEHDNILSTIPLTFSRMFSQPGTSGMGPSSRMTVVPNPAVTMVLEHLHDYRQNNHNRGDTGGGGGGGAGIIGGGGSSSSGGSGNSSSRSNERNPRSGNANTDSSSNGDNRRNNSNNQDIYLYDDGNVDFDFD